MGSAAWKREEYFDVLPELPHVGWCLAREARRTSLLAHSHAGAWEICWIRRGSVDWWAGDGSWEVPQGHLYITRPDEEHGATHTVHEPCELFWLQLRQGGIAPEIDAALAAAPRHLPADERLTAAFWELLREGRAPAPLRAIAARAALHRLVVLVVRATHGIAPGPQLSPAVAKAIALASSRLEERVAVGAMAAAADLSPSRFHARFLAETGQTPADWLRRARLRRAKRLLATTDRPVTGLAFDLGFPTSQYFATVFRRYTGMTPLEWRRQVGSGPT